MQRRNDMDSAARKRKIMETLENASAPISAASLARELGVSRQIIVGDVALIRAGGTAIDATPRGYVLQQSAALQHGLRSQIVCQHSDADTECELNIIVDNGCKIIDVIVEHPVYGQLTGLLNISSRYDVKCFLQKVADAGAHSLCQLTDGIHTHTIEYPDQDALQRTLTELERAGILYR